MRFKYLASEMGKQIPRIGFAEAHIGPYKKERAKEERKQINSHRKLRSREWAF